MAVVVVAVVVVAVVPVVVAAEMAVVLVVVNRGEGDREMRSLLPGGFLSCGQGPGNRDVCL